MNKLKKELQGFEYKKQKYKQSAQKIQDLIHKNNASAENIVTDYLIRTQSNIDVAYIISIFGQGVFNDIILKALEKSIINKDIILNEETLYCLDFNNIPPNTNAYKNLNLMFNDFNLSEKLKFTLYMSGLKGNFESFSFAKKWFLYDLCQRKSNDLKVNNSIISAQGYNPYTSQTCIFISLREDGQDGIRKIAKSLHTILESGAYKNTKIKINSSSKNSSAKYGILLIEKGENNNIHLAIKRNSNKIVNNILKPQKTDNLLDQIVDLLTLFSEK